MAGPGGREAPLPATRWNDIVTGRAHCAMCPSAFSFAPGAPADCTDLLCSRRGSAQDAGDRPLFRVLSTVTLAVHSVHSVT